MPQYTIKLNTYDPAIVEAFERLRKNRKQTAFTHEALKYFLASETGVRTIELMSSTHLPPLPATPAVNAVEPSRSAAPLVPLTSTGPSGGSSQDHCSGILGRILE